MKINHFFKSFLATSLFLPMISGCSSTEIIDSKQEGIILGDEIILNLSSPESLSTRVDDGHKLRYIAVIYEGTLGGSTFTFIDRKEITDGENDRNTIIFRVLPNYDYKIILFADYIPSNYEKDENGYFKDYYYDTSMPVPPGDSQGGQGIITMRSFIDSDGSSILSQHCINNDNYDCFSLAMDYIHKTEEVVEEDVILKRAVAKVRFVSTTGLAEDFKRITFSSFDFYNQFNIMGNDASRTWTTFKKDWLSDKSFSEMTNPGENEIFYFYTLAPTQATIENRLKKLEFSVETENESLKEINVSIEDFLLPVQRNSITTVKGAFLPGIQVEDPENDGKGDIILHITSNQEWNEAGLSYEIK